MIKYDRFWVTMKERGITQYDLYEHYQITRSLLDRLRKNKNVEISRLSYGIPVGTEIDYLDALTLERAFEDRRNL